MPSNESINRDLKATAIEQALVEMGFTRVPEDKTARQRAVKKAGYASVSDPTWFRVAFFLADRFPTG